MRKWEILVVGLCICGGLCGTGTAKEPARSPRPVQKWEMPRTVENTKLLLRELAAYEGPFWEDGSGEEVADIAALVVENVAGVMISHAQIILETDKGNLEFSIHWLPADGVALVPEAHRAPADDYRITGCSGWSTTIYPEISGAVTAREQGLGELVFTNHTTQPIAGVKAVYRPYDPGSGMYIGGSAQTLELAWLRAGEERCVTPVRYACGYTKVVCILLTAGP